MTMPVTYSDLVAVWGEGNVVPRPALGAEGPTSPSSTEAMVVWAMITLMARCLVRPG